MLWINSGVCVLAFPSLSLSLFKHLQIHAQRLLNRVFTDELDKVLDIVLSVRDQLVDDWLPHHGLCDLSGVVCRVKKKKKVENMVEKMTRVTRKES